MKLAETLALFIRPDEPVELRFLGVERPGRVHAGWITLADAPAVAAKVDALAAVSEGTYFTPQRLKSDVLTRSPRGHFGNVRREKGGATRPKLTHDDDVAERRYFIIDVDPKRPEGLDRYSATDAEKAAAMDLADQVCEALVTRGGMSRPLVVDSGNGRHCYFRMKTPLPGGPVSVLSDGFVNGLGALSFAFPSPAAEIDVRVYNPSRIMKLPGTWARKGPDLPDRPHRLSRVIEVPDGWQPA